MRISLISCSWPSILGSSWMVQNILMFWYPLTVSRYITSLSCSINFMKNELHWMWIITVAYWIPYLIFLVFITLPIVYLESALGQYCSLPPLNLFSRLSPAFAGWWHPVLFIRTRIDDWIIFFNMSLLKLLKTSQIGALRQISAS